MNDETNSVEEEDWSEIVRSVEQEQEKLMEAEERRYNHVRKTMAYQKSLKHKNKERDE